MTHGQISPGKLAESHSHLEGIRNCTQCHILGKKVSNQKCLDCHGTIQSLINSNKGYHASDEVKKQDCFECHSDHHGRKFDMVRFDQDAFEHILTGYALEGAHASVDCRECHIPDYIDDLNIAKRENTFLGLTEDCASCHTDYHQATLSTDCASCHSTETFRPASGFNHSQTEFNLLGAHLDIDCVECHPFTSRNGMEFQEFNNIPFDDCVTCHKDPHQAKINGSCMQCHTESSFETFIGNNLFDHNRNTAFDLKGKHWDLNCYSCHAQISDAVGVFQDKIGIDENSCVSCHQDVHENKFGTDCAQCHQESSFRLLKTMDFFDHSVTDYALEGRHVGVDCKSCHEQDYLEPIDFTACQNCHIDYHEGQFADQEGRSPDCANCHSVFDGFEVTHYTIEQHMSSEFPLEGAHLATPCNSCHMKNEKWTFKDIGINCISCHTDIHDDEISEQYYPEQNCAVCHVPDAWNSIVAFDHTLTEWPLEGGHIDVDCKECHFEFSDEYSIFIQSFKSLTSECTQCHENIHRDQFAIQGKTNCTRCHVVDDWFPSRFNHNETMFPLEGKHVGVACIECHKEEMIEGSVFVNYQIEQFECIDCHQ